MSVAVKEGAGFITFDVKVIPGSSKNMISGEQNGALKIKISAAPDKGKANTELTDFISAVFGVKNSGVEIIRGEKSRHKSLKISGITKEKFLINFEKAISK
jgi:uncharacterized protein (TIGR00251 family)